METKQTKHAQKGSTIRQVDPYNVYEHLQLSLEEVCQIWQLSCCFKFRIFYKINSGRIVEILKTCHMQMLIQKGIIV